jgi:hypothetical protein
MKTLLTILSIIISFSPCNLIAQQIEVNKVKIGNNYKIELKYQNGDTVLFTSRAGCDVREFTYLSESIKIKAIEELLKFEEDTSLSEFEVTLYNTGYFKSEKPKQKLYNLQVDALFYINYLALSSSALFYSPYPLLYDKERKKEIGTDYQEIKNVFDIYKNWLSKVKKCGFANYSYPLVDSKYVWFGSIDKKITFKKYPYWEKDDGCKYYED